MSEEGHTKSPVGLACSSNRLSMPLDLSKLLELKDIKLECSAFRVGTK